MTSEISRKDSTIEFKITIPWQDVDKTREEVIKNLIKDLTLPGFRKGQAPEKIAREKLAKEKINEEMLRKVLPDAYVAAVKEQKVNPIINPKIHVDVFEEGTPLVFTAETCEAPEVDLKTYKEDVKGLNAKTKIAVPGKEEKKVGVEEIIDTLIKSTEVKLPKVLVDEEVDRLLSQMLDELKSLGISLDQFLTSRGKTPEQLRAEYSLKAEKDLKVEFILRKVADVEKITVEQKDIEDVLNTIKDEKQKQEIVQNPYFLASIIRQQKTLDFLTHL